MRSSRTEMSTDTPAAEWCLSPRGRKELVAIILFCAAVLIVPPCAQAVYSLPAATMFSSRVEKFCVYEVFDSDGNQLSTERFGLHLHHPCNSRVRALENHGDGQQTRFSIEQYGAVAPRNVVVEQVQRALAKSRNPRFVYVAQKVIGAKGARHVGVIQAKVWKVPNPRYENADLARTRQELSTGS